MKKLLIVLLLAVMLSGCSGVLMNPAYTREYDSTVQVVQAQAKRATAGTLEPPDMVIALRNCYVMLRLVQDARTGRAIPDNRAEYLASIYAELSAPDTGGAP